MKLVVISPESADPREIDAVRTMLGRGLMRYHVRKPGWSDERLVAWCQAFSAKERECFVLHGAEALARSLGLGGAHWRDDDRAPKTFERIGDVDHGIRGSGHFLRTRSCHDLAQVHVALGVYDSVFLSPVFPSVSKLGHGQTRSWTDAEVQNLLASRELTANRTEVIALGGIQKSTTVHCRELGFDGAAALGSIWQAADPVAAFVELRDAVSAFAGRPLLAGPKSGVSSFS